MGSHGSQVKFFKKMRGSQVVKDMGEKPPHIYDLN